MKPRNIVIINEGRGNVDLYHIRVEVAGVPLWTGVYAESVERANRIATKTFGKGNVHGRPTKVKESRIVEGAITLYRGVNPYQSKGHLFWTTDREWARQFTNSGLDREIKTRKIPESKIYRPEVLPKAFGMDDSDIDIIKQAQSAGYPAIWMNEGSGQPKSVFFIPSVVESKGKGPHNKVKKGSQRREKVGFATDSPDKYVGKWEAYDEPQGVNSPAGQKMLSTEAEGMPDVKTYSPMQIAKKHGVSLRQIQQQLKIGTGVELEHTGDRKLAREIALDHLLEFPDYYDRLEKMERVEEGDESSLGPSFSRGLTNSSSGLGAVPSETDFDPNDLPNKLRAKNKVPGSKSPASQVIKTVNRSTKNKVRKANSPVTEDILNELFGGGNTLPYDASGGSMIEIDVSDDASVIIGFESITPYMPYAPEGVNVGFGTMTSDGRILGGFEREDLGLDRKTLIALFNTVIEIVQKWVKQNNPDRLYFIAVDSMKVIYPKLIDKFVPMDEWTVKKGAADIAGQHMDVYKLERKDVLGEMARLPTQTKFSADYEVKNGEKIVGKAKVTDGVIDELMINQESDTEDFKGHSLSVTLGTIIRDADLQGSNLAMKIVDLEDQDMKRYLERFGFRHVGDGVFKRTAGAITPPSVIEKKYKT